jgi:uncharacterized protein YjiS (DUF1127 family)
MRWMGRAMAADDIAPYSPKAFLQISIWLEEAVASGGSFGRNIVDQFRHVIRIWAERDRDRRQLLDLLESDHRTAGDMGTTAQELEDWARKPFWRP